MFSKMIIVLSIFVYQFLLYSRQWQYDHAYYVLMLFCQCFVCIAIFMSLNVPAGACILVASAFTLEIHAAFPQFVLQYS